ncbi:MAG: hypothetical protein J6Q55_01620, partial [Clostridia bacterium]|nr:hypothetical protein [Clostridia bacterium]
MKKLVILLLALVFVLCTFAACDFTKVTYTISSEKSSYTITVGDQPDYKSYFTITSSKGENITVTEDMIDTSTADTSKPGAFIITCTYENASNTIIFVVNGNNQGGSQEHT